MTLFEKIGYTPKNTGLLDQALTHKSYFNENPGEIAGHNERLEFLGDSVLDLAFVRHSNGALPRFTGG